jgi:hypothetical protein
MGDLAKLAAAYATLKTGTLWSSTGKCKGYATANPGEAAQIDGYVNALVGGSTPTPPALATSTGKGLVGIIAAGFSSTAPPPPPPPGSFAIVSSLAGGDLSGPVKWEITGNAPIAKVEFFVDGVLKTTESVAPYVYGGDAGLLDPAVLGAGSHVLRAKGTAVDGQTAEQSFTVTVSSVTPPPPPPATGVPTAGISTGSAASLADQDQCKAVGAQMVRFDHDGSAAKDATALSIGSKGMVPLMIVFGTDRNPRTDPGPMPGQLATRMKDKFPFRMYEILNEPDLNGWTPAVYAPFAKACAAQIHAADPAAIVWCGGFWIGRSVTGLFPQDFAKAICEADVKFDAFSAHIFDSDPAWNNPGNGWHMAFPHGDLPAGWTVREILDAHGRANIPLICSEGHAFYRDDAAAQAAQVSKFVGYTLAAPTAKTQKLGGVCVYTMHYAETGTMDSALLNPDGTRRPSWQAFHDAPKA